jgi:hypothetical protein
MEPPAFGWKLLLWWGQVKFGNLAALPGGTMWRNRLLELAAVIRRAWGICQRNSCYIRHSLQKARRWEWVDLYAIWCWRCVTNWSHGRFSRWFNLCDDRPQVSVHFQGKSPNRNCDVTLVYCCLWTMCSDSFAAILDQYTCARGGGGINQDQTEQLPAARMSLDPNHLESTSWRHHNKPRSVTNTETACIFFRFHGFVNYFILMSSGVSSSLSSSSSSSSSSFTNLLCGDI